MKRDLAFMIMGTVVLLSIITLFKPMDILAGGESYYHLIAAQPERNPELTVDGRPAVFSQYDYLLSLAFLAFEPVPFMKIFPILLGALCIILVYFISGRLMQRRSALYTTLIFLLSPAFLYIFSTNSAEMISLVLLLTGALLLTQKGHLSYLSIFPFIFASLSSSFVAVLSIIILVTFFIFKMRRFDLIIGSIVIVGIALIERPFFIINYQLSSLSIISELFSDFGGLWGISVFTAIFFIAGLLAAKKRRYIYPVLIFLIISFFIEPRTVMYANVLVCGLAGIGLNVIIEKKWQLKNLKYTMNFLLITGILFSAVSHLQIIRSLPPEPEFVEAASWLNTNADNGTVLSSPSNSFFIEYFSQKRVLMDPLSYHSKSFEKFSNITNETFYSRSLEKTEKLLNMHNIAYIMIDPAMMEGGVWGRPNQGLLFLLTNEQVFPTVYNRGGVKIIYHFK